MAITTPRERSPTVSTPSEERSKYDVQPTSEASASPEEPPDGGYGWVCVACTFFINMHTWGVNSSYGVFLAFYLAHDYYPNATPLQFAFVGGLSISQALLVSPLATYTTREYGTRCTLLIGIALQTLALIGASFTHKLWQLLLSQGLCFGYGMGFLFVGSVSIVPQWFTKRRSLANGIGTAGSGLGGLTYSLATNAMIESIGVGWAFRILGIISFAVNFVCAMLMRDRNKILQSKQMAFDYVLFKRPEYWLLLGWGFFSMLGYVVLLFSLPNYAVSIGLSAKQGSQIGALLNLGQGLGRPAVGMFSDAAGRINLAGLCTFIAGFLSLVMWINAKTYGIVVFFAILVGTVSGTFWTAIAPVGAEVVGLKELPSGLAIMWLFLVLPTTFSEPIGLQLKQTSGNIYLHAQLFAGFMYVAAALCMLFLRAWKIKEIEDEEAEAGNHSENVADGKDSNLPMRRKSSNGDKGKVLGLLRRTVRWKKV